MHGGEGQRERKSENLKQTPEHGAPHRARSHNPEIMT